MKKLKFTTQQFIDKARKTHGETYDYSKSEYQGNNEKLIIICKHHGEYIQAPCSHWNGHGCNKCAIEYRAKSISLTLDEFIERSNKIHNNKYDYSKVIYLNSKITVEIICLKHGSFWQKPGYHLIGCNCPVCSKAGVSELENNWLNDLNIKKEYRQYRIHLKDRFCIVDGFDPETNTIYEFNGDFWHGNPSIYDPEDINDANGIKFGDLYNKTIERENILKSAGFNVIVKWETNINGE